ncbi:Hypothetical predicted protein [Octopus vulgaris]|uniref:Uncharacterized protein n=1 Tax=Octopus vulgaris TaxID=6645 RepID=A0AA36BM13_OCTVU|nr:Hypothetical predicted protein [Octopus vulgaris]
MKFIPMRERSAYSRGCSSSSGRDCCGDGGSGSGGSGSGRRVGGDDGVCDIMAGIGFSVYIASVASVAVDDGEDKMEEKEKGAGGGGEREGGDEES